MKRGIALTAILWVLTAGGVFGQRIRAMEFRNRPIGEILMVLADTAGTSVVIDETVTGQATFHFSDSEFSDALKRFSEACHMYTEEREGVWYVSRIQFNRGDGVVSLRAEDTMLEHLVKAVARGAGITILYDELPRMQLSVFAENYSIGELLEVLVKKLPEYGVVHENGAWYLRRQVEGTSSSRGRLSSSSIRRTGETYTMEISRGNFSAVLALLFKTGGREYSLLHRNESVLENLYFEEKKFEELLRLVCEQGSSDYAISGNIYYIFEIQRRDVLKKFKETEVIELRNLSAGELAALLPAEYSGSGFVKVSVQTNSVYLTGSAEEIGPIGTFIRMVEEGATGQEVRVYELQYLKFDDFVKLLPKGLAEAGPKGIPGTGSFIVTANAAVGQQFEAFIKKVDVPGQGTAVRLRYINSAELLEHLPPSITKDDLRVTADPTLVFFTGSAAKRRMFDEELALLDEPKPQIRYQILVIQYQKSRNFQMSNSITVNPEGGMDRISGNFSNLLNINFDVISELGHQFALQLNNQIGEDRARVLVDTTLNGISGQEITFENTTTFRYLDVALDPETGKALYRGTTREINSGLHLKIHGWASGEGMITIKVEAGISKQDEVGEDGSSTNPPPTSERSVNTQVRTRSGSPVAIGGLLQMEKARSVNRVPVLGYIPLIGLLFQNRVESEVTTEMVIYIVPFLHTPGLRAQDIDKRNEGYYRRYAAGVL
jgi:type II secretory pathway component GspD/PulD (secretin)